MPFPPAMAVALTYQVRPGSADACIGAVLTVSAQQSMLAAASCGGDSFIGAFRIDLDGAAHRRVIQPTPSPDRVVSAECRT
ncbi:hypothetical protein GCM10009764_14850 [Nocardia ninae]|uniref:Uncharacterized protein n=1 Tax=Nocardia ninae NBRC 108245 TaxID=1210091 RepID=A0A511M6L9_9NOCA|nr:hypothetical protein NN4_07890 [Nocardia ninae NBRC 108245]